MPQSITISPPLFRIIPRIIPFIPLNESLHLTLPLHPPLILGCNAFGRLCAPNKYAPHLIHQSHDLFAHHYFRFYFTIYLVLFQRMIRPILTLEQHTPALQTFQRMPSVILHIQHPWAAIGIQCCALGLFPILIKDNPPNLPSKKHYRFRRCNWSCMIIMQR